MRWFVFPAGTFDFLRLNTTVSNATVVVNEDADIAQASLAALAYATMVVSEAGDTVQASLSSQALATVVVLEADDTVAASTTYAASIVAVVAEADDQVAFTAIVLPVIAAVAVVLEDPDTVQSSTSIAAGFFAAVTEGDDIAVSVAVAQARATVNILEASDTVSAIANFPVFLRSFAKPYNSSTSAIAHSTKSRASQYKRMSDAKQLKQTSACKAPYNKSIARFSQVI